MEESMKINSGAVLSSLPDDAHVLAVDSGGGLRRLTPSGLRADIRADLGMSMITSLSASSDNWVRIAKSDKPNATFCGILTVSHLWNNGMPIPLLCFVNSASGKANATNAYRIASGSFYAPSSSDNNGLSFTMLRFVTEDDATYVEVKVKANTNTPRLYTSLCGQINLELVDATVSTATADKVLKTIDLCSGGGNALHYSRLRIALRRSAGRRAS